MLACTYALLRGAPSQKLVVEGSTFCHPIGWVSLIERKRLHDETPSSTTFDPIRRIVAGSGVGVGALGSPGPLKSSGPPPPEPPAPPPPLTGPRLFGWPEKLPPPAPLREPVLSPPGGPARNWADVGGESPAPLDGSGPSPLSAVIGRGRVSRGQDSPVPPGTIPSSPAPGTSSSRVIRVRFPGAC